MTIQQILNQIMQNQSANSNPLVRNALVMYQNGNTEGLKAMADNLCKERGISLNEAENNVKRLFGIR